MMIEDEIEAQADITESTEQTRAAASTSIGARFVTLTVERIRCAPLGLDCVGSWAT